MGASEDFFQLTGGSAVAPSRSLDSCSLLFLSGRTAPDRATTD